MVLIQTHSKKNMKFESQQLRFPSSVVGKISQKNIPTKGWVFHGDESHGIKSVKITLKNKQTQVNKVSTPKKKKTLAQKSWKVNPKTGLNGKRKKKLYIKRINLDVSKNRGGYPKWMVKIMEHLLKMGWFGWKTHYFRKHPKFGASPLPPFCLFPSWKPPLPSACFPTSGTVPKKTGERSWALGSLRSCFLHKKSLLKRKWSRLKTCPSPSTNSLHLKHQEI